MVLKTRELPQAQEPKIDLTVCSWFFQRCRMNSVYNFLMLSFLLKQWNRQDAARCPPVLTGGSPTGDNEWGSCAFGQLGSAQRSHAEALQQPSVWRHRILCLHPLHGSQIGIPIPEQQSARSAWGIRAATFITAIIEGEWQCKIECRLMENSPLAAPMLLRKNTR